MPTNLYGQGDNYHPQNSHVLPALIRRFHEAGATLCQQDLELEHCESFTRRRCGSWYYASASTRNHLIGSISDVDISIGDLTRLVMKTVGYEGDLTFDVSLMGHHVS